MRIEGVKGRVENLISGCCQSVSFSLLCVVSMTGRQPTAVAFDDGTGWMVGRGCIPVDCVKGVGGRSLVMYRKKRV